MSRWSGSLIKVFNNHCVKKGRQHSPYSSYHSLSSTLRLDDLDIDFTKLKHENFVKSIEKNIQGRKGVGNIRRVAELKEQYDKENNSEIKQTLYENLVVEALKLPNAAHPIVESYKEVPCVIKPAHRLKHSFPLKDFSQLSKELNVLRTEALSAITGERSYYFMNDLVELEQALIKYIVGTLLKNDFQLISVPDIIPANVVKYCGMTIHGERSQVYFMDERLAKDTCLSGTAEMALAGMLLGRTLESRELPLKYAAVSRCFRSETSNVAEERGIYRVHQFTKVEMFGVCEPGQSEELLSEFLALEESNFNALGLDFQIIDMPLHELAAPAYRKYDVEAWFPGRQSFGEISSCSNCTDYQSRRLRIRFRRGDDTYYVHTVNGTACAIPRMVMALFESHQRPNGTIGIPRPLVPLLGQEEIRGGSRMLKMKFKSKGR